MNVITEQQCMSWLSGKLGQSFDRRVAASHFGFTATYALPIDTGRKTAFARGLGALLQRNQTLVWVTSWGVFPSSENMSLFSAYRASIGERRSLRDAPGHLLLEGEGEQLECLLDLVMYFYWDASVFSVNEFCVQFSHDEMFDIRAQNEPLLQQATSLAETFGFERSG